MRWLAIGLVVLCGAAIVACQAQPKEVFAYRLPDAPLHAAAADPPPAAPRAPLPQGRLRLDLNRAPAAELARVPGLDSQLAARIVAARPWHAKRDLLRHRLLTASQYARAKPYLVVHRSRRRAPRPRR